ncbi:MAG: trypsin-like peptidase domain-containing protein [Pirellulaceae bacterium]|nr:trypsin-like peptidase domain-containing protein [Pirellulaceae bacterium]
MSVEHSSEITDDTELNPSAGVKYHGGAVEQDRKSSSSKSLSGLIWLLCGLLVVWALRYVVPYYVEEVNYAAARGRQRAEVEIATDGLHEVGLSSLSIAYQLVSKRVGPSVVYIDTMKSAAPNVPRDEFGFLFGQKGFRSRNQGSGIIMDEEGYTLTNYHVIERATSITVGLPEGRTVQAQFIGGDSLTDLALIKIETPGLIAAEWGDSDTLEVGSLVWAVGSPFGFEQSITAGILSAKNRPGLVSPHQRFLQTDAAVNPGNSGGPLVDATGRVVGINTAILGESYRGISFAIPSSIARGVYEDLKSRGMVPRGWLGVALEEVHSERAKRYGVTASAGAVVMGVFDDSPAMKAGIQTGDVIVQWGPENVESCEVLSILVAETPIGTEVGVVIFRDGMQLKLPVAVELRPRQMETVPVEK